MRYQKSFDIEQRLAEALRLIQKGRYSTPLLAEALDVSIPTVYRFVTALRRRRHDIRADRHNGDWRYTTRPKAPKRPVAAGETAKST